MKELDDLIRQLPEMTQQPIRSLLKKKEKEAKMEKILIRYGIITIAVIVAFAVYIYMKLKTVGIGNSALTFLMGDLIILIFIAALISLFFIVNYYKRKFEKAEKDVDKIREDMIDRTSDIWNTEALLNCRYPIFKLLKDVKDIDLFHK